MKRLLFFGIYICAVQLISAVSFRAFAPDEVEMGKQFNLSYTIDVGDGRDFRMPDLSAFDVMKGPFESRSSNFQIMNGTMVSSARVTYTYSLMPKREGTFTIGAANITSDQQIYSSNSLTIKVLPASKSSNASSSATPKSNNTQQNSGGGVQENVSNENIFVRVIPSKVKLHEQDFLLLTYKIYSLVDLVSLGNAKLPDCNGFLKQDIEPTNKRQLTLESYNGKNYSTLVLYQTLLYPQKTGNIQIEKANFEVVIRVRTKSQVHSIFDDFFGTYQEVKKMLVAPALTIAVDKLPEPRPADFSGAVGSFAFNSSISAEHVATNDAITLKYTINGTGNLKLIKNPHVEFPADFEVYDPKITNNLKNTTSGVTGSKTIEYLLIPRSAGDFVIPAYTFFYFDIHSQIYKKIVTPEYKIHVEKGAGGTQTVSSDYVSQEQLKRLGQDIRYIYTDELTVRDKGVFFFGTVGFWLWYILPLLAAIGLFVVFRKQVKANADVVSVRNRKANKVAIKRLKKAKSYLEDNRREDFYEETLRALWGYLSDKLAISVSALSKDNVVEKLEKQNVEKADIEEFMDILSVCEFARYAPSTDVHAMDNLYERTITNITKLQETLKN